MTKEEATIVKEIKLVEKAIISATKGKKDLTGQAKDGFANKLDKLGEKVDQLNDDKKIDAKTTVDLKKALKKVKSQLD